MGVFLLLLYAPIIVLVAFSFNDSRRNVVWRGFTTRYYGKALDNDSLTEALTNSLIIATASTVIAVLLAVMAAIWLWRFRFAGKVAYEGALTLPIIIPEICMGIALLIFFNRFWPTNLSWPWTLSSIIVAHVTFTFPFITFVIRARLHSVNRHLEEAAIDLGANEWWAMVHILLPQIRPALIASALIAFTLSLDDFVITYFTSGPDSITLPVKIHSMVRFSVTPEVNAVSTVLIVLTALAVLLALKFKERR